MLFLRVSRSYCLVLKTNFGHGARFDAYVLSGTGFEVLLLSIQVTNCILPAIIQSTLPTKLGRKALYEVQSFVLDSYKLDGLAD